MFRTLTARLHRRLHLPPRFTLCFACTLVATALAFALLSSQGVLGA